MNAPYEYYKMLTDIDTDLSHKSGQRMEEYIKNSEAVYHGIVVRSLYIPKIFTETAAELFSSLTKTMYTILKKVIAEYENNSEYRKLFGFEPRLEELILRKSRYEQLLPLSRLDIFFNDEDYSFKFCEFNADGASAMNEDRELNNALLLSDTFTKFKEKYNVRTYELFHSWAEEFINIYNTSDNPLQKPNIVITDFFTHDVGYEFKRFRSAFADKGLNCEIVDITKLEYDGKHLTTPSGMRVDAIYRRAVTCDIMEHYDEVQPFINAVKDDNVILIGDFKTQIIHNKIIFKVLHDNMTSKILDSDEVDFIRQHIPFTTVLIADTAEKYNVFSDKDSWVIKPEDSYASKGFHAGVECKTSAEWVEAVKNNIGNGYILQEYVKPYEILNIDYLHEDNPRYRNYSSITGLFVYNGKFSGIYSRIAKTSIISTQYSEMSLPSIVVSEK